MIGMSRPFSTAFENRNFLTRLKSYSITIQGCVSRYIVSKVKSFGELEFVVCVSRYIVVDAVVVVVANFASFVFVVVIRQLEQCMKLCNICTLKLHQVTDYNASLLLLPEL